MPRVLRRFVPALVVLLLLFQGRALALPLTPAQILTLKNDILVTNSAALQIFIDATDDQSIADWYNVEASPVFWVWRSSITEFEVTQKPSRTGTTFTWAGTGFIGRTAGELTAWDRLFRLGCNPSLPNVRQAFLDIFSGGTTNANLNRAHLDVVARRKATRLERLFATGNGGDTNATSGTMEVEGLIDYRLVARVLRNAGE